MIQAKRHHSIWVSQVYAGKWCEGTLPIRQYLIGGSDESKGAHKRHSSVVRLQVNGVRRHLHIGQCLVCALHGWIITICNFCKIIRRGGCWCLISQMQFVFKNVLNTLNTMTFMHVYNKGLYLKRGPRQSAMMLLTWFWSVAKWLRMKHYYHRIFLLTDIIFLYCSNVQVLPRQMPQRNWKFSWRSVQSSNQFSDISSWKSFHNRLTGLRRECHTLKVWPPPP